MEGEDIAGSHVPTFSSQTPDGPVHQVNDLDLSVGAKFPLEIKVKGIMDVSRLYENRIEGFCHGGYRSGTQILAQPESVGVSLGEGFHRFQNVGERGAHWSSRK